MNGIDYTKEHGMALHGFGVGGKKHDLVRMEPAAIEHDEQTLMMIGNTVIASTYILMNSRAIKNCCWYLVAKTQLLF